LRSVLAIVLCGFFVFGMGCVFASQDADARRGGRKVRTVKIHKPYGDTYRVDSNRRVPIIVTRRTGYAKTKFRYSGGRSTTRIWIHPRVWRGSKCTLRKVIRHEKAHAAGWRHYERPRHKNNAYHPSVYAC
jgi:hypothetical protein